MGSTHYSNNEEKLIKDLFKQGKSDTEIVQELVKTKLNATIKGVAAKRRKLGLFHRSFKGRHAYTRTPVSPGAVLHANKKNGLGKNSKVTIHTPNAMLECMVDSRTAMLVMQLLTES